MTKTAHTVEDASARTKTKSQNDHMNDIAHGSNSPTLRSCTL
jgi:hypothetical protein